MHASTSGYLDTPAKHRDMISENVDQEEMEDLVAGEFHVSFSIPCVAPRVFSLLRRMEYGSG